ncbi:alanine--tRNA ligase [Candidatus Woesearchaeota archaeon]|nr:alanine--tRNA ligase [Candidatus Woesearchaeota archaeon]
MFKRLGYTPIKRYPVVARWRDDTDFVQASIYDFQPYVVSGEIKPPANPLVVPQFCLRFNDIDNVGITGAHNTGFDMIGQHAFDKKNKFDQEKYLKDIHQWLNKGLGLKNEKIVYHEDAWLGGGNLGPCMEFFSGGVELGNQVYMKYKVINGNISDLDLNVLDMGMGHERNTWFSNGSPTSYDVVFPTVIKELLKKTAIKYDKNLISKFVPYAGLLNIDELKDSDKTWNDIANKISYTKDELKEHVLSLAAIYSIADHSRSLLFAISDGALPSNTGGGYNLRVLFRRSMSFIDKYKWNIYLPEICKIHALFLKSLYPELLENIEDVKKILDVEEQKYNNSRQRINDIVKTIASKEITENDLLKLYDSNGIPPELIREEAIKQGKLITIPEDFYSKIALLHENKIQEHQTKKEEELNLNNIKETEALYFSDYKLNKIKTKVLKIINNKVILEKTIAYPTSGGQLHDIGFINDLKIVEVIKQGPYIIHTLEKNPSFRQGNIIEVKIDLDRRLQLAKHHTSTHIINAAARRVLGKHINQAGAKKTVEKAHIDLTHYSSLTEEELKKIEAESNRIIKSRIKIEKSFMSRNEAESKYGFSIYQGGVVPGKELRIVNILNMDVEACGGTHLDNTIEAEKIKILKSSKISDSIVRIEFVAGKKALEEENKEKSILEEVSKILDCEVSQIPGRAEELFNLWKDIVKKNKKISFKLTSRSKYSGDLLTETSMILKTQPDNIIKTISRFIEEIKSKK